mgnify:FL=1
MSTVLTVHLRLIEVSPSIDLKDDFNFSLDYTNTADLIPSSKYAGVY